MNTRRNDRKSENQIDAEFWALVKVMSEEERRLLTDQLRGEVAALKRTGQAVIPAAAKN